jgi:hypothetical protein
LSRSGDFRNPKKPSSQVLLVSRRQFSVGASREGFFWAYHKHEGSPGGGYLMISPQSTPRTQREPYLGGVQIVGASVLTRMLRNFIDAPVRDARLTYQPCQLTPGLSIP